MERGRGVEEAAAWRQRGEGRSGEQKSEGESGWRPEGGRGGRVRVRREGVNEKMLRGFCKHNSIIIFSLLFVKINIMSRVCAKNFRGCFCKMARAHAKATHVRFLAWDAERSSKGSRL